MKNEEQFLPGFEPQEEKSKKDAPDAPKPEQTEKFEIAFSDEKIQCQYCEDVGPCQFCDRGKDEIRKLRKR